MEAAEIVMAEMAVTVEVMKEEETAKRLETRA